MSLTNGSGPFGISPAGTFNFDPHAPEHVLYVEPTARRVRVLLGGVTVADSNAVLLLHPPGRTPTYLFPPSHVRTELFEPSRRRRSDAGMGTGTYWTVRVGSRRALDAAYSWEQPPEWASSIPGRIAFDWDSMDGVFEEDEEVFVHPRDPYTRIDVLRSSRRVVVRRAARVIASSSRPRILYESGLPSRYYLPWEDIDASVLEPSPTTTRCPYKGVAHYWSWRDGSRLVNDIAWSYPSPTPEVAAVRGLVCFVDDAVTLEVDDAPRPREATKG